MKWYEKVLYPKNANLFFTRNDLMRSVGWYHQIYSTGRYYCLEVVLKMNPWTDIFLRHWIFKCTLLTWNQNIVFYSFCVNLNVHQMVWRIWMKASKKYSCNILVHKKIKIKIKNKCSLMGNVQQFGIIVIFDNIWQSLQV